MMWVLPFCGSHTPTCAANPGVGFYANRSTDCYAYENDFMQRAFLESVMHMKMILFFYLFIYFVYRENFQWLVKLEK